MRNCWACDKWRAWWKEWRTEKVGRMNDARSAHMQVGIETIISTGLGKNLILYRPLHPPTTHFLYLSLSHTHTHKHWVIFSQQAVETWDRKKISALMEENDFTNAQADSNCTSIKGSHASPVWTTSKEQHLSSRHALSHMMVCCNSSLKVSLVEIP